MSLTRVAFNEAAVTADAGDAADGAIALCLRYFDQSKENVSQDREIESSKELCGEGHQSDYLISAPPLLPRYGRGAGSDKPKKQCQEESSKGSVAALPRQRRKCSIKIALGAPNEIHFDLVLLPG